MFGIQFPLYGIPLNGALELKPFFLLNALIYAMFIFHCWDKRHDFIHINALLFSVSQVLLLHCISAKVANFWEKSYFKDDSINNSLRKMLKDSKHSNKKFSTENNLKKSYCLKKKLSVNERSAYYSSQKIELSAS